MRRSTAATAESVDPAAIAFRRAACTPISDGDWLLDLALGWRRAVVGVTVDRQRCADALGEETLHDHDPTTLVQVRLDAITEQHWRRRLHRLAVDIDVPAAARCGRVGSRLRQANGVEPLINADTVDPISVPARPTCGAGSRSAAHDLVPVGAAGRL